MNDLIPTLIHAYRTYNEAKIALEDVLSELSAEHMLEHMPEVHDDDDAAQSPATADTPVDIVISEAILAILAPKPAALGELLRLINAPASKIKAELYRLREAGKVVKIGDKRGARYRIAPLRSWGAVDTE